MSDECEHKWYGNDKMSQCECGALLVKAGMFSDDDIERFISERNNPYPGKLIEEPAPFKRNTKNIHPTFPEQWKKSNE